MSDNKARANHNNQFRCLPDSRTTLFQQKNNIDGSHHSASRQSTSIPFNHCRLVLQLFRRSTLNYLFNLIFFTLINLVWPMKLNFILWTAFKLVLIIYLFSVLHLCAKVVVISCRGCVTRRNYGYPEEIDANSINSLAMGLRAVLASCKDRFRAARERTSGWTSCWGKRPTTLRGRISRHSRARISTALGRGGTARNGMSSSVTVGYL